MSTAVIAGGGPGGLYLAWRLLTDSKKPFDNVQIYEMSPDRIGCCERLLVCKGSRNGQLFGF